ncbi:E3 ubiquitin-protein ligase RNF12-B-like [Culex pipiens pallens]|uniref:E3 ubiquitin-protein ligase RNF12-B-like n=1 Tax=Culex pipiens pallens TaxID=42434 RepID=UPI0019538987|nr:E3 ubiquitin-protein ligase RNF12-B-like [Culex pipiens pallens]
MSDGVQLPVTLIIDQLEENGICRAVATASSGESTRLLGPAHPAAGRRLLKNSSLRHRSGEETTNTPEAVPIEKDDLLERLEKIDTSSPSTKTASATTTKETGDGSSAATNDVDMENDDLIQRLEAIENGEAEESAKTTFLPRKMRTRRKMIFLRRRQTTSTGWTNLTRTNSWRKRWNLTVQRRTASSAKRRHSEDEELEPSSKKVHVEDDTKKPETVTAEKKNRKEDKPAVEESVNAEEEPQKEPETVDEPPKEEEKVPEKETVVDSAKEPVAESKEDEKTAPEEKPLEVSAPPPEPDPVEEPDSKVEELPAVETPALETAPEEKKKEKPEEVDSVPDKKDEPVPEPAVDEKKLEEPKEDTKPSRGQPALSATDSSGTISGQSKAPLFKVKHTVRGAKALASLMIEEFTKNKRVLSKDDELSDADLDQSSSNAKTSKTTTKKGGRGNKRNRTENRTHPYLPSRNRQ